MALKRKRSTSAVSPFSSSSSATISSRDASTSPCPDVLMLDDSPHYPLPVHRPEIFPSHLHSRTRKRFRDNRPDESIVHEITYQRLFAAARSPPPAAHPAPTQVIHARPQPTQRQPSLHNFWAISSPPNVSEHTITSSPNSVCEDCESPLPSSDTDTSMGGVDNEDAGGSEYACRSCRRRVCGICAVVEVGVGRECLQCRTSARKKWVGGIGWMS